MPTVLDIILYDEFNFKRNINIQTQNLKKKEKEKEEEEDKNKNKKYILDSFVNYPRLELIKKYKIQTYQFLMNKNYKNTFLKLLTVPIMFELCYNIFS